MNSTELTSGLDIVRRLFAMLEQEQIAYCSWKSNEHLDDGLLGKTDLDLLFDPSRKEEVEEILSKAGFVFFETHPLMKYRDIYDYIGMDASTTSIVHVHLHFRLVIGEKFLKSYHLPWEPLLLSTRRFDPKLGTYVCDPHLELILLLTREALKRSTRNRLLDLTGKHWLSRNSRREMSWLVERIDENQLYRYVRQLFGAQLEQHFRNVVRQNPRPSEIRDFVAAVKHEMRQYRFIGPVNARIQRSIRELRFLLLRVARKAFPDSIPLPIRRSRPGQGIVIAFVGTDGAGKSTAVESTTRWLTKKLDVFPLYLGSGKGRSSLLRKPLQLILGWVHRRRVATNSGHKTAGQGDVTYKSILRNSFQILWAFVLVFERKLKLRRGWTAKRRGMIVVIDRFPQAQVAGYNDGPLLYFLKDSRLHWLRRLAIWEEEQYAKMFAMHQPDIVFRLEISPETAVRRRPEMFYEKARAKQEALRSLQWGPHTRVVAVDANQELGDVERAIRQEIWKHM